jgi:hypothetical protein
MHLGEDEILFVHRGELEVRLADSTYRAGAGATVFVPRGNWIGFRARNGHGGLFLCLQYPGFEKCLRALSARPASATSPRMRRRWSVQPRMSLVQKAQ